MKKREFAMNWWNNLSSAEKTRLTDISLEIVKTQRRWETLTGSEIEKIYELQLEQDYWNGLDKDMIWPMNNL